MRFLPILVVLLSVSCGPEAPPKPPAVSRVPWQQLVWDFRDTPDMSDRAYRGRLVQVHLPAKSYRVSHGRIEGYLTGPDKPGALVFECETPPDNTAAVILTGTCQGLVRDGIARGSGIEWHIRVSGCSVTVLRE